MDKESAKTVSLIGILFIAGVFALYGIYWVAKTVSYTVFYEDMVKETISYEVKKECLE
tara:strand:- start:23744 stop:23917 length:174 start_codon:yes stop_codon:yes gene_type:complete